MDDIIDKLISHIKDKNIKFVTISESNHRSYTSHTFHYKFVKALYENKIINTFSSERLGINDAEIINYYIKNKLSIDSMVKNLPFGGMGFYRIVKYFYNKSFEKFKIVGLEADKYCPKSMKGLPKDLSFVKDNNLDNINREEFWLENIKKIIEERGNLFINGFHLSKKDLIGKYLIKNHPDQTLILSMSALEITTQVLIIDNKIKDLTAAIMVDNYKMKVENIKKIAPPTDFEKKYDDWKLIKVTEKNKKEKFRAVGCYLAVYENEYKEGIDITDEISYRLKNYDYVIFFKKSIYKEKMFF